MIRILASLSLICLLAACSAAAPGTLGTSSKSSIPVTEGDIADRPYKVIKDLHVTVNTTTIFNANPTPSDINARLQQEAAALGADAVILARYGKAGMTANSWGTLEGRGRAVKYD